VITSCPCLRSPKRPWWPCQIPGGRSDRSPSSWSAAPPKSRSRGVRDHLESLGWATWQLPDRVELIDRIPVTGTGKFDKKLLRARLADPDADGPAVG
jgi:hypothetical protein